MERAPRAHLAEIAEDRRGRQPTILWYLRCGTGSSTALIVSGVATEPGTTLRRSRRSLAALSAKARRPTTAFGYRFLSIFFPNRNPTNSHASNSPANRVYSFRALRNASVNGSCIAQHNTRNTPPSLMLSLTRARWVRQDGRLRGGVGCSIRYLRAIDYISLLSTTGNTMAVGQTREGKRDDSGQYRWVVTATQISTGLFGGRFETFGNGPVDLACRRTHQGSQDSLTAALMTGPGAAATAPSFLHRSTPGVK